MSTTPYSRASIRRPVSLYSVAALAVYGGVFLASLASAFDPDFWWHLRAGQWIAANHRVPTADFLSFTVPGSPWLDHEWLSELLTWLAWQAGAAWATLLMYALVITATFFLMGMRMRLRGVHPLVSSFMLLGALLAAGGSIGMRMQMFTLLMLAALLLTLETALLRGRYRLLVLVPPMMCLWANLHGGFMIGLTVILIALVGEVAQRFVKRPASAAGPLLMAFVASTVATLINPRGLATLVYPFRFLRRNPFTARIAESLPPTFHDPVSIAFGVLLAVLVLSILLTRKGLTVTDLAIAAAFTFLAFSQARNIAVWVVAVVPIVASATTEALARFRGADVPRSTVAIRGSLLLNRILLAVVIGAYALIAATYLGGSRIATLETKNFPASAVAALPTSSEQRVFADYQWGGYVSWKLAPRALVFIDGRADTVYPATVLNEYVSIASGVEGWQQRLEQRRANAILLPPDAPLARRLVTDTNWDVAFADPSSVLYLRAPASDQAVR